MKQGAGQKGSILTVLMRHWERVVIGTENHIRHLSVPGVWQMNLGGSEFQELGKEKIFTDPDCGRDPRGSVV